MSFKTMVDIYLYILRLGENEDRQKMDTKGRRVYRMPSKWPFSRDRHFNVMNGGY